jgi:hypothetical protein
MGEDYIHDPAPECQVCGEVIGEDEPTVRRIKPWGLAHERCVCAHCRGPVRGRSPAEPRPLCRRALSVAWSGPECAVLVEDWGHPMPCVDCAGLAGPELDKPGLVWLAALYGWTWDAPEMMEAVTWS